MSSIAVTATTTATTSRAYDSLSQLSVAAPPVASAPPPDHSKDEEQPAGYNSGGYMVVRVGDTFKEGRYTVLRKLGYTPSLFFCPSPQTLISFVRWGHFSTVWLVKDTV
jgi:hypothetical protein